MPGLGEITPVKLQLSRENFNALIGRHSQPVRWLVAENCPCIGSNLKVDENCSLCGGKSVTYSNPTQSFRIETFTAPIDGVIDQVNIVWVRDFKGNVYTVTSQDCVSFVTGVIKGYQYQVKYIEDLTESGSGTAEYVADKFYRIDIPTTIDFGEVQGNLISVTASTSTTELIVTEIFRNCFYISDTISSSDTVNVEYTYTNPFEFALIHNNFSKDDQKFLTDVSGDGLMVFPQRWEVYTDDVIIALNETQVQKTTYRSTGSIDTLPSFYLNELKSAYSIRDNAKYTFTPETDFVILKGNQIQWINNTPDEKEQISMTYSYNVAYKVLQDVPDPRTSESNRFPRKVAIKKISGYNSREGF